MIAVNFHAYPTNTASQKYHADNEMQWHGTKDSIVQWDNQPQHREYGVTSQDLFL